MHVHTITMQYDPKFIHCNSLYLVKFTYIPLCGYPLKYGTIIGITTYITTQTTVHNCFKRNLINLSYVSQHHEQYHY